MIPPPPESQKSRLSDEDRALIRRIGAQLSQLILGTPVDVPDLNRRDELGILANMVSRLARELIQARRRDEAHHAELERRMAALQNAYDMQERLLGEVRQLSSPVLVIHEEVLLVPLIGEVRPARIDGILDALVLRIARTPARAVIVDVTAASRLDGDAARAVAEIERAALAGGAAFILAGLSPGAARELDDLQGMTACADLQEAVSAALDRVGPRADR